MDAPSTLIAPTFDLDLKDARKGRAKYEIRWKKIFESFEAEHKVEMLRKAEQLEAMQKMLGMTEHRRQTMRARLDNVGHQRQQVEITSRSDLVLSRSRRPEYETAIVESREPRSMLTPESLSRVEVTLRRADATWSHMGELALRIGAVTARDTEPIFKPLWLHNELFDNVDDHGAEPSEVDGWAAMITGFSEEVHLPTLTLKWLHDELFLNTEPEPIDEDTTSVAAITTEDPVSIHDAQSSTQQQLKRKDAKQAKKQRAMESRALARTIAEDIATQEAEEKDLARVIKAQKARARKTGGRRGTTPFV